MEVCNFITTGCLRESLRSSLDAQHAWSSEIDDVLSYISCFRLTDDIVRYASYLEDQSAVLRHSREGSTKTTKNAAPDL